MKPTHRACTAGVAALIVMLLLMMVANAQQVTQDSKKTVTQAATQSQLAYQKMDHVAEGASQEAAQNCYAFEKKVQTQTAAKKMTQSGKGNAGNPGSSGAHDRSGGNG